MEIVPQNQCFISLKSVKSWYVLNFWLMKIWFGIWFSNLLILAIGFASVFTFAESDIINPYNTL